jgi:NTE family protein
MMTPSIRFSNVFVVILCLYSMSDLFAQEADSLIRPKIGLVLSGGGAKGLAHIGVLKVIEEAGIKIDYIGGTSMGAIIGGLYASGYTANQLDSIFTLTNYDAVIRDYIPRGSKNFYEKNSDDKYAISLPFTNGKIGLPSALSKGLYNYNLVQRLTHNVREVRDFNQLPIPFLCIATNIETGEEVVLNSGYLAQAVMASGAFPSLYSPVEIDGAYLIDGGVVNNYPVNHVRAMGADIIIGVDVQDELKDREALQDATRLLVQVSNLQMAKKMQINRTLTDIYIKPDVSQYSVISFDQGNKIIANGIEAAKEHLNAIEAYSIGHLRRPINVENKITDSIKIAEIVVPEMINFTRSYVVGKLGFKTNTNITYEMLKRSIETLNATQNFSLLSYTLQPSLNGDVLKLFLTENEQRSYLKLGLHYDGLFKSALLTNYSRKRVLVKNDVLSFDLILGDNLRYNFDYYYDNGFHWSFGFKSRFSQFNRNIKSDFSDGSILDSFGINSYNLDFSDFTHQAFMQTMIYDKFVAGGGIELKHLRIKSQTLGENSPIADDSDYLSFFGYMKFDTFDDKYFPKKGGYFNGALQSFFYTSDETRAFNKFSIFKVDMAFARTITNQLSIILQTEGGFALGQQTVPFFNFVLGGYGFHSVNNFRPFYGYDFLSLAGNSYLKGMVTLDYEFYKKNHINIAANYANLGNNIFENTEWFSTPSFSGYAVGYGLETFIGPVEIKHSWSPETKDHYTWFSVGFWF